MAKSSGRRKKRRDAGSGRAKGATRRTDIAPAAPATPPARPSPQVEAHASGALPAGKRTAAAPTPIPPDRGAPRLPGLRSDDSRPTALWALWFALWQADPATLSLQLASETAPPKVRGRAAAFVVSALAHGGAVILLACLPAAVFRSPFPAPEPAARFPTVVYEFRRLTLPQLLPVMSAGGARSTPARQAAGAPPVRGRSHFDPRVTITSLPAHPDNTRLTIETESALRRVPPPPEIKVPDLVLAPARRVVPPPLRWASRLPDLPAPNFGSPVPPPPVRNLAPQTVPAPRPPLALEASPRAAILPASPPQSAAREPPPARPAPSEKSAPPSADVPEMPAPPAASNPAVPPVVALSADPAPLKEFAVIPAGVRAGAFAISPAAPADGAAPGAPAAPPPGARPGEGEDGEKPGSASPHLAPAGGGASPGAALGNGSSPGVNIAGTAGAAGIAAGTLAPLKADDLVYPVTADTPRAPAPRMVVSSGSWGGGGLRVYNVLHGDRIYTVYLPMPERSWILQYCARATPPHIDAASGVVQIHFAPPLTPPVAITQFDFRRPAPPADAGPPMIILHGIIRADGTVSDLATVQSPDVVSGAAARAALARWKFKPALSAGAPVAVEILVGIP